MFVFVVVVVVVVEANYTPTLIKQCCLKITPLQKKISHPFHINSYILAMVNRLSVRTKRLHTRGETTLSPGETTPGEQDIGRNDRSFSRNR